MYLGERLEAYFVGVHDIELLEIQLITFLSLNQVFFPLWGFFQVKSEPLNESDWVFPPWLMPQRRAVDTLVCRVSRLSCTRVPCRRSRAQHCEARSSIASSITSWITWSM